MLLQVLLSQYTTLGVSMSPADWCSCFSRHPDLLSTTPEALAAGVEWLQQVYGVDSQELAAVVLRCPELLHPGQHEIQAKVGNTCCPECCVFTSIQIHHLHEDVKPSSRVVQGLTQHTCRHVF